MKVLAITLAVFSVASAANLPVPSPTQPSQPGVPVPGNASLPSNSSSPVNSSVPINMILPLPQNSTQGLNSSSIPVPSAPVRDGRYLILSNGQYYDRTYRDYVIPSQSIYNHQIVLEQQPTYQYRYQYPVVQQSVPVQRIVQKVQTQQQPQFYVRAVY